MTGQEYIYKQELHPLWLIRKDPLKEDVADAFEYGKSEGYKEALEIVIKKIKEYYNKPPFEMCLDEEQTGFYTALSILQDYIDKIK